MGARKKGALQGKWSVWFLDESGARLTPLVGKTWAPRGRTPDLHHNMGKWEKVGMISAVGSNGKLHFQFKLFKSIKQGDLIVFLKHLLRHEKGKLVVFWDGARQHKGDEVQAFIAQHPDRLRVELLPPYGYEYNPDEGVWENLKWNRLRNFTPRNTKELVRGLRKGLRRIQRQRKLVRAFWRKTELPRKDVQQLLNHSGRL